MSIKNWVGRLVELNRYLVKFPPAANGNPPQPLEDEEIADIIFFGVPNSWRKQMVLQDHDPANHTTEETVEFCQRLEETEGSDWKMKSTNNNNNNNNNSANNKRKKGNQNGSSSSNNNNKKRSRGDDYNCLLHGPNSTHNTDDCFALKKKADEMKKDRDSTSSSKKKKKNGGNPELLALLSQFAEMQKKMSADKEKKAEEDAYNFENLKIDSGSDTESEEE